MIYIHIPASIVGANPEGHRHTMMKVPTDSFPYTYMYSFVSQHPTTNYTVLRRSYGSTVKFLFSNFKPTRSMTKFVISLKSV